MAALTLGQQRLLAALDGAYVRAPFTRSWWLGVGYVALRKVGERFLVSDIWVEGRYRGTGEGGRMLRKLCAMADEAGVDLFIYAKPFDAKPRKGDGLDTRKLREWYARAGFAPYSKLYHLRTARPGA